jgi:hypothetical protein
MVIVILLLFVGVCRGPWWEKFGILLWHSYPTVCVYPNKAHSRALSFEFPTTEWDCRNCAWEKFGILLWHSLLCYE